SLTLGAAFAACAVSGELGSALLFLFPAALVAAPLLQRRIAGRYQWAWTGLLGLAMIVQGAQVVAGRLDIVLGATQFAVLLAVHRLWHRSSRRDEWFLLLLSLLLICAGAALSAELLFGLCFLLYSVAATWALALTWLRFEIEAARSPEPALARPRARGLDRARLARASGRVGRRNLASAPAAPPLGGRPPPRRAAGRGHRGGQRLLRRSGAHARRMAHGHHVPAPARRPGQRHAAAARHERGLVLYARRRGRSPLRRAHRAGAAGAR